MVSWVVECVPSWTFSCALKQHDVVLVVVLSRLFARLIKFGARLVVAVMVVVMVVVMVLMVVRVVVPASSPPLAWLALLLKFHLMSILLFVSPHESSTCHRHRQHKVSIRWEDLSTSLHNPKQ